MSNDTCIVCGKSKASIGETIREMQRQDIMVVSHDLIAHCTKCDKTFCSDHYDLNDMAGTHICRECGSDLDVERIGYFS